jgi:hypothetical protein
MKAKASNTTDEQDGREWMSLDSALAVNNVDYDYSSSGGMVDHNEEKGTYTVASGHIGERYTGLAWAEVPMALKALGMKNDQWSYE